jgi:hypothetical protein
MFYQSLPPSFSRLMPNNHKTLQCTIFSTFLLLSSPYV